MKKAAASLARSGTVVELLPASNREVRPTLARVGPEKKHEVGYEFAKNGRSEGIKVRMEILIEESAKRNNSNYQEPWEWGLRL